MVNAAQRLREAVEAVPDPELPDVTIGQLGIVRSVAVDGARATIVLTPTYTGCPATELIADDVAEAAAAVGFDAEVHTSLSPAWTTGAISPDGHRRLAAAGIAPPVAFVHCPRCGSANVKPVSEFGSTACMALYTCQACREPFERFKPI